MTRRIVLHCGLGKTGTSALQVQFAQGRDVIIEKLGFDYIEAAGFAEQAKGAIASGNGAQLARSFLPPANPISLHETKDSIVADVLEKVRASKHHILLSSEFFSAISNQALKDIVDLVGQFGAVELVFFTRNQVSLMASGYMQQVKRHGEQRYPEAFWDQWLRQNNQRLYHKRFSKLKEVMPGVTLHLQLYENSKTHAQGMMGLFLDTIGLDGRTDLGLDDTPINTSPSPLELRLMLEINRFNPRMQFSDMLVEASAQAGRSTLHAEHTILSPDLRREIKKMFQADNEAFFKTFFDCENLYNVKTNVPFVDLKTLQFDPGDVVSIIGGLLSKMDQRIARLEQASAR